MNRKIIRLKVSVREYKAIKRLLMHTTAKVKSKEYIDSVFHASDLALARGVMWNIISVYESNSHKR